MSITIPDKSNETTNESKLCNRCALRHPITEFRFQNRATNRRHSECNSCHVEYERKRNGYKERKGIQRALAMIYKHRERRSLVEGISADMVHWFGGMRRFTRVWKQPIDADLARKNGGGMFASLSIRAIVSMIAHANEARRVEERQREKQKATFDLDQISDDELREIIRDSATEALLESPVLLMQVAVEHPDLVKTNLEAMGWEVKPPADGTE